MIPPGGRRARRTGVRNRARVRSLSLKYLSKEVYVRIAGLIQPGRRTPEINLIDQILVPYVEKVDGHLTADHLDARLQTQIAQLCLAGHAFRSDGVLHHAGHHRLHARNRGSRHWEPLIHAHGHRHAGIAQRAHRKTQVFFQQLQFVESKNLVTL